MGIGPDGKVAGRYMVWRFKSVSVSTTAPFGPDKAAPLLEKATRPGACRGVLQRAIPLEELEDELLDELEDDVRPEDDEELEELLEELDELEELLELDDELDDELLLEDSGWP